MNTLAVLYIVAMIGAAVTAWMRDTSTRAAAASEALAIVTFFIGLALAITVLG